MTTTTTTTTTTTITTTTTTTTTMTIIIARTSRHWVISAQSLSPPPKTVATHTSHGGNLFNILVSERGVSRVSLRTRLGCRVPKPSTGRPSAEKVRST